jgi:hypothetical protein
MPLATTTDVRRRLDDLFTRPITPEPAPPEPVPGPSPLGGFLGGIAPGVIRAGEIAGNVPVLGGIGRFAADVLSDQPRFAGQVGGFLSQPLRLARNPYLEEEINPLTQALQTIPEFPPVLGTAAAAAESVAFPLAKELATPAALALGRGAQAVGKALTPKPRFFHATRGAFDPSEIIPQGGSPIFLARTRAGAKGFVQGRAGGPIKTFPFEIADDARVLDLSKGTQAEAIQAVSDQAAGRPLQQWMTESGLDVVHTPTETFVANPRVLVRPGAAGRAAVGRLATEEAGFARLRRKVAAGELKAAEQLIAKPSQDAEVWNLGRQALEERVDKLGERHNSLTESLQAAVGREEQVLARPGAVVRPPQRSWDAANKKWVSLQSNPTIRRLGLLSDDDLGRLAESEGLNPAEKDWWDGIDPVAVKDFFEKSRGAPVGAARAAESLGVQSLREEMAQLEEQLRKATDDLARYLDTEPAAAPAPMMGPARLRYETATGGVVEELAPTNIKAAIAQAEKALNRAEAKAVRTSKRLADVGIGGETTGTRRARANARTEASLAASERDRLRLRLDALKAAERPAPAPRPMPRAPEQVDMFGAPRPTFRPENAPLEQQGALGLEAAGKPAPVPAGQAALSESGNDELLRQRAVQERIIASRESTEYAVESARREIRAIDAKLAALPEEDAIARATAQDVLNQAETGRLGVQIPPERVQAAQRVLAEQETAAGAGAAPPRPPEPPAPPVGQPPIPPADDLSLIRAALEPPKGRISLTGFWDAAKKSLYDRVDPLAKLEKQTGIPTYRWARLVPGAQAKGEEIVSREIDPILDGLGKDVSRLQEYMVLRRAEDIRARFADAKLPGGLTQPANGISQLQRALGAQRFARIEAAAAQLWQKNREMLARFVDEGLLNQRQLEEMTSANPHYIDFHRQGYDELSPYVRTRPEAHVSSLGIDRLSEAGSTRSLQAPLANFRKNVVDGEVTIARNKAARATVQALEEQARLTGDELVRVISPSAHAVHDAALDTISYFENGQKVVAQVPRWAADVAKSVDVAPITGFWRFMSVLSRSLRAGAVTYNPAFAFVVNPIYNVTTALLKEGVLPQEYVHGLVSALTKGADYQDAARSQVLMSGLIENFRTPADIAKGHFGRIELKNWGDALLLVPRLIERFNVASEQAARIVALRKLKAAGVGELEAALRSRDVTIDFSKMGDTMRLINIVNPFTNAALQGSVNFFNAIKRNPGRAAGIFGAAQMPVLFTWAWNQQFETNDLIPDYEYERNFVLQIGEGTREADPKRPGKAEKFPIYIKVPKGPVIGPMTLPAELVLRYGQMNSDKSAAEYILDGAMTAASMFSPISELNPLSLAGPGVETAGGFAANYDPFTGEPIVPSSEQRKLPEQQFGAETSETAIELGQATQVSPRKIEWAIRNFSSSIGEEALFMLDLGLKALGYNPTIPNESRVRALTTAEEVSKQPVLRRFIGTRGTQEVRSGYRQFDKAVSETERSFAKIPDVTRLGIAFGEVGSTIKNLPLEPVERASYQRISFEEIQKAIKIIQAMPAYASFDENLKRTALQKAMSVARDLAQRRFLQEMGAEKIQERAAEIRPADTAVPITQPTTPAPTAPPLASGTPTRSLRDLIGASAP